MNLNIGIKDVLKQVPVSERTWYRMMKNGIAPKPFPISERRVCWRQKDIDLYLRIQEANAGLLN